MNLDGLFLVAVPQEILARGPLAFDAYTKALKKGKTTVKRMPVMLIGQDRSGKTSLKKSLRGQIFNPEEESTVGIEKDPSHFKVTREIWKVGKKDEAKTSDFGISYEHHAAQMIVKRLKREERTPAEEFRNPVVPVTACLPVSESDVEEEIYESVNIQESTMQEFQSNVFPIQNVESPLSHDASSATSEALNTDLPNFNSLDSQGDGISSARVETEVPDEIASLVEKLLFEDKIREEEEEKEEEIFSVLWDFGGQSVYYVTHPLFLTPRAMYLLVHDLSRDPYDIANPPVKQGMFKKFKDDYFLKTNLDYLDFWMTSVASLAGQVLTGPKSEVLPEKLPPVFLVCTHADEPCDWDDPYEMAQEVFDFLQRKPYSAQLVDQVFVVDNTKSGSKGECSEIIRLRKHILAVAKELPQMKEVIPVKWLKYEKALQVIKEEGHKWISLQRAEHIASVECNIDDEQEFVTLLNFLHDERIVVHFDDTPILNLGHHMVRASSSTWCPPC